MGCRRSTRYRRLHGPLSIHRIQRCLVMMEVSRPVASWPQRPTLRLPQFFPLALPFLADAALQKTAARPSSSALRPCGCGRRQAGFETSIEAAIGAAEINDRRLNMATIGTFTKTNDGFTGTIQTVGLKAKVTIAPVEKRG